MGTKVLIETKNFSHNLRVLLAYKNLNIKSFSSDVKIDNKTIGTYMSGKRIPPLDLLIRIAEYFKVKEMDLIKRRIVVKFNQ